MSDDVREITVTEAGALVGVSGETIRKAIRDGKLKIARQVGKSYLVRPDDVLAWARGRARDAEPGKFPQESN